MPRTLSEAEFNQIRDQVLASLPPNLSEADFNKLGKIYLDGAVATAEHSPAPLTGSAVSRFVSNFTDQVNPAKILSGLYHAFESPEAAGRTVQSLYEASKAQGTQALDLARQGRYVEAAGHAAAMTPIIGPAAAAAGEQIASGDIGGGLGAGAGQLAAVLAPGAAMRNAAAIRAAGQDAAQAARAAVGPLVRGAVTGTAAVGDVVSPRVIGLVSPRAKNWVVAAQELRDAMATPPPAAQPPAPATAGEALAAARAAQRAAYDAGQAQTLGRLGRILTKDEYAGLQADLATQRAAARAAGAAQGMAPASVSAPAPTSLADLAAPGAAPPAAPAPPAEPATPPPAPTSPAPTGTSWSPQRIRNEVGLAARRAKLTLSADQAAQAEDLVRAGQSPADAVTAAAPPAKLHVPADAFRLYTDLRRRGLSHQEAATVVRTQLDLAARLGTPSTAAVQQAVAERNATGRWPD